MNKQIPALRFPQFAEHSEWEEKKLGEVSEKIMYGMNAAAVAFDGKHKYLRITDIEENTRQFIPNPLSSPSGLIEEKYKLTSGDIVFTRTGASVGKSYLYNEKDGDLYFAGFLIKFAIKNVNPYFVFYQTLRTKYNKWVTTMSMRSGQPGINAEEYKEFPILFPSLPEQNTIADFLSAVDKRILLLKQKYELLKLYKKGIMQQIFSQELRFKDDAGQDFPEWEEKTLGEVAEINKGTQFNKILLSETGKYPCLNGGILPSGYSEKYNYNENTITISEGGNSCGFVNFMKTKFWCGGHCYAIIVRDNLYNHYNNLYLYQVLKYNEKNIMELRLGGALPNIQKKDLIKVSISLPCLSEQKKIAEFLTAIDEKIENIKQQIELSEEWKRGLLQKMLI